MSETKCAKVPEVLVELKVPQITEVLWYKL